MEPETAKTLDIRRFTEADKAALAELYRRTWSATYRQVVGAEALAIMLRDLDERGVSDMLPGNDEVAYVASDRGRILGSAIFAERNGTAYLWGMYIDPAYQRRGIGTQLLSHGVRRLLPNAVVEASVVKASTWAIAFYEKLGFRGAESCEFEIVRRTSVPAFRMTASREVLLARIGRLLSRNEDLTASDQ